MKNAPTRHKLEEIVFRTDLYPRLETNPLTVQEYAANLTVLPPIEVNQHCELIDGWHRWTAHKKAEASDIACITTSTTSDAELLELAIARNATHGLRLSLKDKCELAIRIYSATPERERQNGKKEQLAGLLSVDYSTVARWLSDIDKHTKQARDQRIFGLWLANYTLEEIGQHEGLTKETISEICQKFLNLEKSDKHDAEHSVDFEPPLYNIWKQQDRSAGPSHPGNTEINWLDNLLYLYTNPFDLVIDPFAGSGTTIDLCKKRFRRYWASDRKPIVERAHEIRCHDLTAGLPPIHNWQEATLVYLDPPYWCQTKGKYSDDSQDLANMPLDHFHIVLADVINQFAHKLKRPKRTAYLALMISPTQWPAPDHAYTDHVLEMCRRIKLPVAMRYSTPYSTQQYYAPQVEWAKSTKNCLVLTRELVVWAI